MYVLYKVIKAESRWLTLTLFGAAITKKKVIIRKGFSQRSLMPRHTYTQNTTPQPLRT